MSEKYIPGARDSVVGFFGRTSCGNLRCYCVRCNDKEPLTGVRTGEVASKIYGDLYVTNGGDLDQNRDPIGPDGRCEVCGITFLALSESCQREHDEQQIRFSRIPVQYLDEMGMRAGVRCRIY